MKSTVDFAKLSRKMKAGLDLYGQTAALKLQGIMIAQAPWQDRSTNARNSLKGEYVKQGGQSSIILSGNMEYSIYLELAMSKRYAIIKPTATQYSKEVFAGYKRALGL